MFPIKSITVVCDKQGGSDLIMIQADVQSPEWPFEETTNLKVNASHGKGEQWCLSNFPGVPVKVV